MILLVRVYELLIVGALSQWLLNQLLRLWLRLQEIELGLANVFAGSIILNDMVFAFKLYHSVRALTLATLLLRGAINKFLVEIWTLILWAARLRGEVHND